MKQYGEFYVKDEMMQKLMKYIMMKEEGKFCKIG
jgi:hypothetical protein